MASRGVFPSAPLTFISGCLETSTLEAGVANSVVAEGAILMDVLRRPGNEDLEDGCVKVLA